MSAGGYLDACGFIATSSGSGNFVVSAAVLGCQTPASAGAANTAVYSYRAESADKSQWEEGFGAYTVSGTTLARTTITANSSGGTSAIVFSTVPNVYITALSQDLANASLLTSGTLSLAQRGYTMPDAIIEEQQASGTGGGTNTAGAWFTRVLNMLVRNANSIASLATNQVTLGAGTYYMAWSSPCGFSDQHQSRLFNVTDAAVVAYGSSEYSTSSSVTAATRSVGGTVVTIAASKAFRIEHRVLTSSPNVNALGVANAFGNTQIYSRLEITQLA
jgi:hypothetical protein